MKRAVLASSLVVLACPQIAEAQRRPTTSTAQLRTQLARAQAEIAAQRQRIDAQEERLHALELRLTQSPATNVAQNDASGANTAAPGPISPPRPAAIAQGASASSPGDPATIQQGTIQTGSVQTGTTQSGSVQTGGIERVGERPANSDRPPEVAVLGSEGSVVTRRGQLTGEVQIDYARADRNRALFRGIEIVESVLVGEFNINESRQDIITDSVGLRYGLTDRLEIGARLPVVWRSDASSLSVVPGSTSNDSAREINSAAKGSGIGDVEFSARYQLLTARGGLPFLVGNLQVVAPTGTNPFEVPRNANGEARRAATGAGFWGVSPSVTAILPTDPAVLFGTIGYTHNFGRSVDTIISPVRIDYVKPGDAVAFSAGIGVALNERTSLNLGYAHTWAFGTLTRTSPLRPGPTDPLFRETTSRDLQIGRLLFGVTYRATDEASINWSVEVGATDDAPDMRTVLRLPLVLLTGR